MSNQTENKNLNHLTDPTFTKVNGLFVLWFENEGDRTSFSKYYTTNVEMKEFNVFVDGKTFFDTPVGSKEEAYNCTTDNLLNYEYFSKHYKLIAIDFSKQLN